MELELVEKIFSYDTEGNANTQKGIYLIKNHFVHFYFTFLYPNLSALEQLAPEKFYSSYIAPFFKCYPICPPRQGPHVGVDTIAPPSINVLIYPFFIASR